MNWSRRGWIGGVLAAVGGWFLGSRVNSREAGIPVQPDLLRCSRTMRFIARNWPELVARVPLHTRHFTGDRAGCEAAFVISYEGAATHPSLVQGTWISSHGWRRFLQADVPDGFFACCTINRGGSEYLCAMWRAGDRRFWFYDQYVVLAANSDASVSRTRNRLRLALSHWAEVRGNVVFRCGELARSQSSGSQSGGWAC